MKLAHFTVKFHASGINMEGRKIYWRTHTHTQIKATCIYLYFHWKFIIACIWQDVNPLHSYLHLYADELIEWQFVGIIYIPKYSFKVLVLFMLVEARYIYSKPELRFCIERKYFISNLYKKVVNLLIIYIWTTKKIIF